MIKFEETGLSPEILRAVADLGFESPTPIQEKTISHLINSENDLVALAQTGTGKTAAFSLPIVEQVDPDSAATQALILCPTRELCMQVARDIQDFTKYLKKLQVLPIYGGAGIEPQIKALKKGAQIVVGTPGRVIDLMKRKKLIINDIQWMVLDEADEMLNMGFKDDLDFILAETPPTRQTLLFSATMPPEIAAIAKNYMNNPEEVTVGKKNSGAENVQHTFYMVHARDRYLALKRLADINPDVYGIVFCRTRRETKEVADRLMQDGYNADALHGDLSQAQRDQVMGRFRSKHLQILVATDVAARGLDVDDLTHVINFSLPDDIESYIHRSGRTGRAGKSGTSIAIINMKEMGKIRAIEKKMGKQFEKGLVPDGKEICERQLLNLVDKIHNIGVDEEQIAPFMDVINEKLASLDKEEIIKKFVSVEFSRFLDYYQNASDLNANVKEKRGAKSGKEGRGSRRDRDSRKGKKERGPAKYREEAVEYARFHINVGSKSRLNPVRLMGLINDNTSKKGVSIGKIEILRNFSFFEVDAGYAKDVQQGVAKANFNGVPLEVTPSKGSSSESNGKGSPKDFGSKKVSGKSKRRKMVKS